MLNLNIFYFSVTDTTKKMLQNISKGLGADSVIEYNVPEKPTKPLVFSENDGVLLGAPVYAELVPKNADKNHSY